MGKHNNIYQKIVTGEKDLIGIVAYSIYKKQKVEIISNIKKKKNCNYVKKEELTDFNDISNSNTQIEKYRNEAKTYIKQYSETLMQKKLNEIEKFYRKKAVGRFFTGVWQSVIGSLIFTLLIGILIFILWSLQFGIEDVIKNVFKIRNQ